MVGGTMNMRILWLLCLALTVGLQAAPTSILTDTTTHVPDDAETFFSFPSGDADSFYTDAMVAVIVESVYADGVALTALPYEGALRAQIGTKSFRPVLPSRMLYRLSCRDFISAKSRDKKGGLDLRQYEIPMDSKKIEISYRIRYPSGYISQEMQIISLSAYEFKTVNDK